MNVLKFRLSKVISTFTRDNLKIEAWTSFYTLFSKYLCVNGYVPTIIVYLMNISLLREIEVEWNGYNSNRASDVSKKRAGRQVYVLFSEIFEKLLKNAQEMEI